MYEEIKTVKIGPPPLHVQPVRYRVMGVFWCRLDRLLLFTHNTPDDPTGNAGVHLVDRMLKSFLQPSMRVQVYYPRHKRRSHKVRKCG